MLGTARLLRAVFAKELREVLRDVNTLLFSVLFPLLFFPGSIWVFTQVSAWMEGQRGDPVVRVEGDVPLPPDTTIDPDAAVVAARVGDTVEIRYASTDAKAVATATRVEAAVRDRWPVTETDIAPADEPLAHALARAVPILLVLSTLVAALYPAVEVVVAERERGTVETTLVTAAPRWVFFAGKLAGVLILTLLALVANALAVGLTVGHLVVMLESELTLPLGRVFAMLPLGAVTAVFLASMALLAAVPTRSFKQAQNTTTGAATLVTALAMVGMVEGLPLEKGWGLVPVTNVIVLMARVMEGREVGLWGWAAAAELLVLTVLAVALAARLAGREVAR